MRAVNLLPADLRGAVKAPAPVNPAPEESGSSAGAFFALGALALCVLGLAGYVLTTNDIKQHESDLVALEARSAAVQAELVRLRPYADFASMATERTATVHDLASQRFDWEGSFRDLARALPADVSVQGLVGSVSSQAGGGSPLRGALDVPAIELKGCTSDQHAVARTMARLRAVDGVTRVSLDNAVKLKTDDAVNNSSAASGAPVTGCEGKGKSDPADFVIVVFFERDAAASADPAAPAADATTTEGDGSKPPADGSAPAATATPDPSQPAASSGASGTTVPTSAEAE